jgi:hypothetical protein
MCPFVYENIYQSFTLLFENSLQLHHGMIIIEYLFYPWSSDAILVANIWLCVMG